MYYYDLRTEFRKSLYTLSLKHYNTFGHQLVLTKLYFKCKGQFVQTQTTLLFRKSPLRTETTILFGLENVIIRFVFVSKSGEPQNPPAKLFL